MSSEKICKDCGVTPLIDKRDVEDGTCGVCKMVRDYEKQIKTLKADNERKTKILEEVIKKHHNKWQTSCSDTCMLFGLQKSELNKNCGDCIGLHPDTRMCKEIKKDKTKQIIKEALQEGQG